MGASGTRACECGQAVVYSATKVAGKAASPVRYADVILELPSAWMDNVLDGERHTAFYMAILRALAELGVTVMPMPLPLGADEAPRLSRHDQLVLSYHSIGPAGHVLRIKESYLPPYYTLDPLGYSGFSELGLFPERFRSDIARVNARKAGAFVEDLRSRVIAENFSKYPQDAASAFDPGGDHIFFPLQTVDDPVARLCAFDQLAALEEVAKVAGENGWRVVVKRHPFCVSVKVKTALERIVADNAHVTLTTASIHRIIPGARAVIGANSGVLFEALIHGAHVVTFGGSDFRMATTPVNSLAGIGPALSGEGRIAREDQVRFIAWFLKSHCVRADDLPAIRSRIALALSQLDVAADRMAADQQALFAEYAEQELRRRDRVKFD